MADVSIPDRAVEYILLGPSQDRRPLQDSPILGDVWLAYAKAPERLQDLLITPHRDWTSAALAAEVDHRFDRYVGRRNDSNKVISGRPNIAYLRGVVAAKLSFENVLRVLVPLTMWWGDRNVSKVLQTAPYRSENLKPRIVDLYSADSDAASLRHVGSSPSSSREAITALDRYIALAGLILWAGRDRTGVLSDTTVLKDARENVDEIVAGLLELYAGLKEVEVDDESANSIFQISLNRRTWLAVEKSVPAVKADAARALFNVSCKRITWAVLDTGIDGEHDAFKLDDNHSRVRKTLDFTRIRDIVSSDVADMALDRKEALAANAELDITEVEARLATIAEDTRDRRPTNWSAVEPLITLKNPDNSGTAHGTHVAGILGAKAGGVGHEGGQWGGMCTDIQLYDLRVIAKDREDSEFAVMSALEYIRFVNEQHNFITIHGANLSLSIPHSVRNYACGQTPVCVECERLVDNGIVVVAAAGNRGYHKFETSEGIYEGYAAFSITDPGNADGVITVGATHGNWPHTYGVSFFSSRGPTGDGRFKPDLVAPGERVRSTAPDNGWGSESGTSMAAPHVSGAAAILMARYPELIGQPRRIKRILCESATDLGREKTFQGHGMLDVLRALQSI